MAPAPVHHPLRDRHDRPDAPVRRRAMAAHPAGRERPDPARLRPVPDGERGSMTAEYGLLIVVGATISSLVIKWATGGAVFELLGSVLARASTLIGL